LNLDAAGPDRTPDTREQGLTNRNPATPSGAPEQGRSVFELVGDEMDNFTSRCISPVTPMSLAPSSAPEGTIFRLLFEPKSNARRYAPIHRVVLLKRWLLRLYQKAVRSEQLDY
jgi:hypothetical protein